MKGLKENKGFTLIELLAVIVVLAIVMVLAVTTVLPYMNNAKKESFALEANGAKDAASNLLSLIMIGSEDGADYGSEGNYCFDISDLKALGLYEKDDTTYSGTVKAVKATGATKYTYTVSLTYGTDYVYGADKTFKAVDVKEATISGFTAACQ